VWLWLVLFGVVGYAAQGGGEKTPSGEQFAGTWTGTWEGAGSSGGFELILEKDEKGAMTGRVSVTGEPTYKATLKSLSFDANKITGKYDFPADDRAEVLLTGTFDDNKCAGAWSAREKGSDNEIVAGTWSVAKK
jgi:hypothetical protein